MTLENLSILSVSAPGLNPNPGTNLLMKSGAWIFLLFLFLGATSSWAQEQAASGPEFKPPFAIEKGERMNGELRVTSFLDASANNHPA